MNPLIAILGVSHKDVESGAAQKWLKHAAFLGTNLQRIKVLVTHKAWDALGAIDPIPLIADGLLIQRLPDECEVGYPKSASHLFLRSLEWAEANHPGSPVLWLECDAIPLHRGWLEEIEKDYLSCGSPFMGHLELKVNPPHMAGCGVYPPNWRELAPSIAACVDAPDKSWGAGKGQAFDTFCAHEILPQAAPAGTIKQMWNCPPFTPGMMPLLHGFSLFHPSKDGRLISILDGSYTEPEGTIDLVYPVTGKGWDHMELRWSLRSIEKFAGDMVRNVWLIGERPDWYKGGVLEYERNEGDSGNADQVRKLLAAARSPEVSDAFVWMNTDFYCQHRPDFMAIAALASRGIRNATHKTYFENAAKVLSWRGIKGPYKDYELHVPMLMERAKVMDMDIPFGDLAFRTLYGNLYHRDAPLMHDVKLRQPSMKPQPEWTWFSTDDPLFVDRRSRYDVFMEGLYPHPSRWELE